MAVRRRARSEKLDLQELLDGYMADADYRELDVADLEFDEEIGQGAYGQVFRGRWRGAEVAIKTLHTEVATQDVLEGVRDEARLMKRIGNHPNVLTLLGAVTEGDDGFCIVTEYCESGSLLGLLRQVSRREVELTLAERVILISDAAKGIAFLHHEGIVHNDIAARNCLLNSAGQLKISDFGEAVSLPKSSQEAQRDSPVAPIKWMAPEALRSRILSRPADVWMFGNLCYEILSCREPFEDLSMQDAFLLIVQRQAHPPVDALPDLPDWLTALVLRCFKKKPEKRITMEEFATQMANAESGAIEMLPSSDTTSTEGSNSAGSVPFWGRGRERTLLAEKIVKNNSMGGSGSKGAYGEVNYGSMVVTEVEKKEGGTYAPIAKSSLTASGSNSFTAYGAME